MTIIKLIVILLLGAVFVICLAICIIGFLRDLREWNKMKSRLDELSKEIEQHEEAEAKFYESIRATGLGEYFDKKNSRK